MVKLTKTIAPAKASEMNSLRKTNGAGSGRPKKPTDCPKCGVTCESARKALGHC